MRIRVFIENFKTHVAYPMTQRCPDQLLYALKEIMENEGTFIIENQCLIGPGGEPVANDTFHNVTIIDIGGDMFVTLKKVNYQELLSDSTYSKAKGYSYRNAKICKNCSNWSDDKCSALGTISSDSHPGTLHWKQSPKEGWQDASLCPCYFKTEKPAVEPEKPPLKPCPFCGEAEKVIPVYLKKTGYHYVTCEGCDSLSAMYESEQEVVDAWNKRQ